ncbi:MAG: hypothetical protein AB7G17_11605 [Phycisphaerales bacterium]
MRNLFVPVVSIVALAGAASASHVVTHRDTLNIPFSVGSGNSNTNFSISRLTESNSNVVELGIKAKERFFGDGNVGGAGDTYVVQPGYSPVSGVNPAPSSYAWWNFDFSIDLGSRTFSDTIVKLTITNTTNAMTMTYDLSAFIISLGGGSLSVAQDSQNLAFAPFAGDLVFNPNAPGIYLFSLSAETVADGGDPLGSANMTVQVVPLPTSAGLASISLLALASRRRRR